MIRWISLPLAGNLDCRYLQPPSTQKTLPESWMSHFLEESSSERLRPPMPGQKLLWVDLIAPSREGRGLRGTPFCGPP